MKLTIRVLGLQRRGNWGEPTRFNRGPYDGANAVLERDRGDDCDFLFKRLLLGN